MIKLPTIILILTLMAGCNHSVVPLTHADDLWVVTSPGEFTIQGQERGYCSIEFMSDGQLRGYTPCNMFYGSYTTAGSRINIIVNGVTMNQCADSLLQRDYIHLLEASSEYVIIPSKQLRLMDRDSVTTLTFVLSARMGGQK